jgi:pSer/pThr/pTyr-binding forkhead associated (FHA) protein
VEVVNQADYRLLSTPLIKIIADSRISPGDVEVYAAHVKSRKSSTAAMQPLRAKLAENANQPNPRLVINGQRTVELTEPLLNIGRGGDNHIVLDDPYVSRHHLQIRRRFGSYTVFDVDSRSGTYVNNVPIAEHKLQPGDVVRLGNTKIVYMTGNTSSKKRHTTQTLNRIDLDDD